MRTKSPFTSLTPETQLALHLSKARQFWLEDRLDLAVAAIEKALNVGIPASNYYDLQRTIEAEWGLRSHGRWRRVDECVVTETVSDCLPLGLIITESVIIDAVRTVTDTLMVRWAMPVHVAMVPEEEWFAYVHARYGYYARRTQSHKICLPPSSATKRSRLRRAVLHETLHAAVEQTAMKQVPRWLNEGLAVAMEGGLGSMENQRYAHARSLGYRPTLNEIDGSLEGFALDLGGSPALNCYAASTDFVGRLLSQHNWLDFRAILESIRSGETIETAYYRQFGTKLSRDESAWRKQ